ncbi:MAG: bifunctional diaminohydroxyphosphoribosylaminopyrimidine deaminase/5-amino-6-(5-phosphoribosylamino)uracil reductase RibD [Flavobacteriaceae bacterium]|nr:bifunctional diaminohydroxyphosphoribosylaminopyrimidine deaminase/5-amino-6-(5-phosphoribosylamino)uracil reductase RibD [Flavobacteriaceae bacterium]
MKIHEKYIKRCIEIAKNGLGSTAPNPMVGCVIVLNKKIIGEGFTSPYGGAHAEVNAINSVSDTSLLKKATLYVTLEPCSHFGKTPPCADLIIKHNIPKVVIGTMDTHSKVAGQGITRLEKAGCHVTVGVLENECKQHHKRFFSFHNKKRPYIILKWAQTTGGFIAPIHKKEKNPVWITNKYSRQLVHKWRAEEQAILVGTNTVLEDNPSLTTRDWKGKHPVRIVLDKNESLTKDFNVFDNKADTMLVKETSAEAICDTLHKANITSVIIEGGAKTLQLFIDSGLWDEARVFTGKSNFNDGVKAPKFSGLLVSKEQIMDDTLKIYVNS